MINRIRKAYGIGFSPREVLQMQLDACNEVIKEMMEIKIRAMVEYKEKMEISNGTYDPYDPDHERP